MIRWLGRFTLWTLLAAAVITALVAALVFWLLATPPGARWAIGTGLGFTPITLRYESLEGNLWHGIRVENGLLEAPPALGFNRIELGLLDSRWRLASVLSGHVRVQSLEIRDLTVSLAESQPDPEPEPVNLPVFSSPVDITLAALKAGNLVLQPHGGEAIVLPDIDASASLVGDRLTIAHLDTDIAEEHYRLQASARFAEPLIFELQESAHGQLQASGRCHSGTELQCEASLDWQQLSHPITAPAEIPEGSLHLQWDGARLQIGGNAELQTPWLSTPVELTSTLVPAESLLEISELTGRLDDQPFSLTGRLGWQGGFWLDAHNRFDKLPLKRWLPAQLAESLLSSEGDFTLRIADGKPRVGVRQTITELYMGGQPLHGELGFTLENDRAKVSKLSLKTGDSTLDASGAFGLSDQAIQAQVQLNSPALSTLLPELAGSVNTHLTLAGSTTHPALKLDASGTALGFAGASLKTLALHLDSAADFRDLATNGLQLENIRVAGLSLKATGMELQGSALGDVDIGLEGDLQHHRLTASGHQLPGNLGIAPLEIEGGVRRLNPKQPLNPQNLVWEGSIQQLQMAFESGQGRRSRSLVLAHPTPVSLSLEESHLEDFCLLAEPAKACVESAHISASEALQLVVSLDGVYLDRAHSLWPDYYERLPEGWSTEGMISARVEADGQLNSERSRFQRLALNARAEVSGGRFSYSAQSDEDTDLNYHIEESWVALTGDQDSLRLDGKTRIDGQDSIILGGAIEQWQDETPVIDLKADGQLGSLAILQPLLPEVRDLNGSGQLHLRYSNRHDPADPALLGSVTLENSSLTVPASGTRVTDWNLKLDATPKRIQLISQGTMGKGKFAINGDVTARELDGEPPIAAELTISGDNLLLVDQPDARFHASPNLTLKGEGLSWHLGGRVRVSDSSFTIRQLPANAVGVSEDARIYGTERAEKRLPLVFTADVELIAGDNIDFAGFGLTTDVTGRLRYTRDRSRTNQLHGSLSLPEGDFKAYGQELKIENGQINFTGPVGNPGLDVRASKKVDTIITGIWLHGTINHPKTELYSVPSMNEADILSYMLTGKPLSNASNQEGSNVSAVALTMGLKQAMPMLQRIGGEFGLSDISVDSGPMGSGGSIAAGKQLSDKLYVKYQYGLVGAVGRFVVELALTDRIKIEMGSGEVDTVDITYSWDSVPPGERAEQAETAKSETENAEPGETEPEDADPEKATEMTEPVTTTGTGKSAASDDAGKTP